jgi:hypothetical protein
VGPATRRDQTARRSRARGDQERSLMTSEPRG